MNRRSISAPHPRARALTVKASTPEPANRGITRSNATPAASVLRLCRRMALAVPATAARTRGDCSFVCNTHLLLYCPHRHPQHGSWLMGWLTMDTLRPRWDASHERSVTCPRPGPRIERRGARVEKTQLGQGLFALESTSGELRRRGAAVLRRGHGTDAGVKGHSSTRANMAYRLWGGCGDVKRPACDANGRPARVEAAA